MPDMDERYDYQQQLEQERRMAEETKPVVEYPDHRDHLRGREWWELRPEFDLTTTGIPMAYAQRQYADQLAAAKKGGSTVIEQNWKGE